MVFYGQGENTRGILVNVKEARESIIIYGYNIRRDSIRRIKIKRQISESRKYLNVILLLENAKQEFDDEMILLRRFKERAEFEIGEDMGPVEDADGRQI